MSNNYYNYQAPDKVYSLRQRYLFVSTLIVLLIFASAWLAQRHVNQANSQYRQDVEERYQATQKIRQLRQEVLHIEKTLDSYMWEPADQRHDEVHHSIDSSLHFFELFQQHSWVQRHHLEQELGDFPLDLKALHISLDRIMELRLESATDSTSANSANTRLAQAERQFIATVEQLQQLSPDLSEQLTAIRITWQRLKQLSATSAEKVPGDSAAQPKLDTIYQELRTLVEETISLPQITSSQQHQPLLQGLREAIDLWFVSYNSIQHFGYITRPTDIPYLKRAVEPHFTHIWDYLNRLDSHIEKLSKADALALSSKADTIAKIVWLLSLSGLVAIIVAYLYFQRTVLNPIATVVAALKGEASGTPVIQLPEVHNLETRHLIEAFDEMRQQVHDRQHALEHIAMHDSLTSLPNRYHLMGKLQALCENSQQDGATFAVMMLGLDRFKEINDTLGQQTGDLILKKFGQRLRMMLREGDEIARFASDEFVTLLVNVDRDEAHYVANKIRNEMERAFDIDGINLSVSCSIGITLYPENGQAKDELTRRANIAMAIAKQHKTGIAFYESRFDNTSLERLALAGKLRQAIHSEGLHLCYQPQFSIHSKRLSGLEVLCRWEEPGRGPISPDEFIPVAEQTGQIHALTEWVITSALRQARRWQEQGLDFGMLSVNISAFNLHAPNFFAMLENLLQKREYSASKLMLEITESAMMADPEQAMKTLGKLQQLGLRLSIDDYGTGFSSLSYVKKLPIHELKIDKSFVMDMISNENDAIIVRSTIDLAHNLGLKVVAEGVDTQEKLDLLEILDCDFIQGFHLGKPLRAEELESLLPASTDPGGKVRHIRDYR